MPEKVLDRLALAQRARDAQMALRLVDVGATGAVLVTGNGHARDDRGVPAYARAREPGTERSSPSGLFEVSPGKDEPAVYAVEFGKGPLPFDFVVFTPAAEREDPCRAATTSRNANQRRRVERSKGRRRPGARQRPRPVATRG